MIHNARLGCTPGGDCCNSCKSHLGDASTSFTDFLAANPDQQAAYDAYVSANPSDPLLQQVMYNPLTNIVGPVPPTYGQSLGLPAMTTSGSGNSIVLYAGIGIAALLLLTSGGSGRRR